MDERIRIRFTRDGAGLPVTRLDEEGIVFAFEDSAKPLDFAIRLAPGNSSVASQMRDVRRNEGWADDRFNLTVTRDSDSLVISGGGKRNRPASLPAGRYSLTFLVSETKLKNGTTDIDIPPGGEIAARLDEAAPDRRVTVVDRAQWDDESRNICEHANSRIDGMDPFTWLGQPQPRMARKACLLNLLAKARALPSARRGESLASRIGSVHWADVDRIAVTTAPGLLSMLGALPGWRDTGPVHPVHRRNLARVFGGSADDYSVESFREPAGSRSLQVVCGTNRLSGEVFAELDIDLGNPKVDLAGFFVHFGELLDPGRTNHLRLFEDLNRGNTGDFLYYTLEEALIQPAG